MAESSKKGAKRGKKAQLAIEAAMCGTSHGLPRILEPDSDDRAHASAHETSDLPPVCGSQSEGLHSPSTAGSSIKSKNTRGPSSYKGMPSRSKERVNVEFNSLGQPIGDGSVKLSSYCGNLVRDMVPIIYDDWRKVPEEIKKNLWLLIKQKFNIEEEYQKKYVLGAMGTILCDYRSRLSTKIRTESIKKNPNIKSLKPRGVDDAQWDLFVKKRMSADFLDKSEKMKKIREAQLITHKTSRRGYARLEEKMKKESATPSSITRVDVWQRGHTKKDGTSANATVADQLEKIREFTATQQSTSASSMKDDAISHVLGPKPPGRVRGVGYGVTSTHLRIDQRSTREVAMLRDENVELKSKLASLEARMDAMAAWMAKQFGAVVPTPDSTQQTTGLRTPVPTLTSYIFKRDEHVKLLDFHGSGTVVAVGRWMSSDPGTMVHNVPLGEGESQVAILQAIVLGTPVWKPTSDDVEDPKVGDVVGSIVAWPTACISPF